MDLQGSGGDFEGLNLQGAELAQADLRGAELRNANLFGTFQPRDGIVNPGALSDRTRITIKPVQAIRPVAVQLRLRELLSQRKASIDADPSLGETTRADALQGLTAGITARSRLAAESFQPVQAVNKLLPLIAGFFV